VAIPGKDISHHGQIELSDGRFNYDLISLNSTAYWASGFTEEVNKTTAALICAEQNGRLVTFSIFFTNFRNNTAKNATKAGSSP